MNFLDLRQELTALTHCYPPFVTRGNGALRAGEIPVFVFHTVTVAELEAQLAYLAANNYQALGLPEFLDTMAGRREPGEREVLLTFDDARSSFWLYAFPLLKKYSIKATVFAITGWTPRAAARPNLDDAWARRVERSLVDSLDPGDAGVCSWEELATMQASGLVTVDSHTHLHRRVFVNSELRSLIRETDDFSPSRAVHSPYLGPSESPLDGRREDFIGLPLLPVRSLLEEGPAIRVDRSALQDFRPRALGVLGRSGAAPSRKQLAELSAMLPASALKAMTNEDIVNDIRRELDAARASLRRNLGDPDAGRTVCVPYTKGGEKAIRVASELGIEGIFWGVSGSRNINQPGQDPMRLVRLKHDFIWRLPGAQRRSLFSIYTGKVRRRSRGARPY